MKSTRLLYLVPLFALLLATLGTPVTVLAQTRCIYYVSTSGSDNNPGTLSHPWRRIQKAANTAGPGQTVCVRSGVYKERVKINVTGSASKGPVIFQSFPGETAVLDGSGLSVPSGWGPMLWIDNQSYITIQNFEIRNYKSSAKNHVPVGILVSGAGDHIELRGNRIHNIETLYKGSEGGDAHGIAVYGTAAPQALTNIVIDGNQLYSLKLGSSESLVVNGNVDGWKITNNRVHDNNNIGIDAIGFEGTSPDPAYDQARNGLIRGNTVYNINSYGNPAYGTDRSADCIYVDGGTKTVVERNIAHNCNIGIELASEHAGKATSLITLRNNFIYNNTEMGIAIGGYDTERGSTQSCVIVNNTLYNNDTRQSHNGELEVQFDVRDNVIKNNIIYANSQKLFISSWSPVLSGNVMDNNLFYTAKGSGIWQWKNVEYESFAAYQAATGNDAHSLYKKNPLFVSLSPVNLHLKTTSPAINKGQNLLEAGSMDIDGQVRVQGARIDLGADEVR
jgi:hypothetical protein